MDQADRVRGRAQARIISAVIERDVFPEHTASVREQPKEVTGRVRTSEKIDEEDKVRIEVSEWGNETRISHRFLMISESCVCYSQEEML